LKRNVLEIGGVIFFAVMTVVGLVASKHNMLMQYPNLISNVAMLLLMLSSVLIKKPFTKQYSDKGDYRIHLHISLIWCVVMGVATAVSVGHVFFHLSNNSSTWLSVLAIFVGIKITKAYPAFYLERVKK
jgi:uncharacterized membrane protein YbjE (DUF340 family)